MKVKNKETMMNEGYMEEKEEEKEEEDKKQEQKEEGGRKRSKGEKIYIRKQERKKHH